MRKTLEERKGTLTLEFYASEQSSRGADLFGWKGPFYSSSYRFNLRDILFLV